MKISTSSASSLSGIHPVGTVAVDWLSSSYVSLDGSASLEFLSREAAIVAIPKDAEDGHA
jgi:hypothetical protein